MLFRAKPKERVQVVIRRRSKCLGIMKSVEVFKLLAIVCSSIIIVNSLLKYRE
jgi:hypothetical protein